MHDYEAPTFFVKGGGSGFSDRQKDIFGQLVDAEKETTERQRENKVFYFKNEEETPAMDVDGSKPPKRQCKKFRGKESIFKVPDVPPLFKPTAMPDFKRNPHKWVRYSLGDVSQDDMSEQANRSAALSFLHEIDERKKREREADDDSEGGAKSITFRNPKKSSSSGLLEKIKSVANPDEEEGKPHFRSSKLIMPEYVVGEKRPKRKAKRVAGAESSDEASKSSSATVKLGHLVDEDEVD